MLSFRVKWGGGGITPCKSPPRLSKCSIVDALISVFFIYEAFTVQHNLVELDEESKNKVDSIKF